MRRTGPRAGFTLLEVIVALVVFGFVLLALNRGVHSGLKAVDVQERQVAARDQLDATDRALRALIEEIDPGEAGTTLSHINGDTNRFGFRTQLPEAVNLASRLVDATLLVDDHHRLVLRWSPAYHEDRLGAPGRVIESLLLTGVETVTFSYWHPADLDGSAPGWSSAWTQASPPGLVRVQLTFPSGDRRHWPDLVIAPARRQAGG